MGKEQTAYGLLLLLSMFLMVVGIQGNVGTVIAILFVPTNVTITP